jgi:predicted nucleic acid-binding protein
MGSIAQTLARMQGQRVYFDTNIFIYVLDNTTGYVDACLPFFEAVAQQNTIGCTGEITIAELMVKPMRSNDRLATNAIESLFSDQGYFETIGHNRAVLELAAYIRATQGLKMGDAIHTASAIKGGCSFMLTHDGQIQRQVKGIEVVNIGDWLGAALH